VKRIIILSFILPIIFSPDCFGQEGVDYTLQKPQKYENRPLGYEKTYTTKFKTPRRFIQNTITHYNYYFNANNKINEILARAKAQNRDDYTQLLSFYNYSLDVTARDKRNLDSVLDKINTAILVRDLRNDWVDNLYMLMGRAFYYKKVFDSAYITFQFVNYAFAPKEEGGYDKPIGSNANASEGGNAFTVSTNEQRNLIKRTFSLPPSRNESLIWQIRTFITMGEMTKAAVLIEILKQDPQFPDRLKPDLHEMQALWFYNQHMYDSAAAHLQKALDNATTRLEQARWEYLIAQLYERSDKHDLAKWYYEKVVEHTYDPIMDVYARLNAIRQNRNKEAGEDYIQKNIEAMRKLARRELYAPYRDIIYYAGAEMELERNNTQGAIGMLLKSVNYTAPNSPQKDKAFLLLGNLSMDLKKYRAAKNYYDSINIADPSIADSAKILKERKIASAKIVEQEDIIQRQDSLQRIAMMTQDERNAYIKKILKALRKQQGLAEEDESGGQNISFNTNQGASDLFSSNSTGEWYFYNPSIKSKGFNEFKSKWGNRPNVDNWQVSSLISRQKNANPNGQPNQGVASENNNVPKQQSSLTTESLLANIPLTPEKMKKSKDSVENAFFILGKSYQDNIPDYQNAIMAYDSLLQVFPTTRFYEETLFHLYYCYKKLGDETNAARILQLLQGKYPNGKYVNLINNHEGYDPEKELKLQATRQYEKVYSDFIEGNFDLALQEKKEADSLYGDKYWTSQLLYIEAVYFVHRREDSLAKVELNNIIKKYSGTPIAAKAKNMLDVLTRRKQLEEYLANLKIERAKEDTVSAYNPAVVKNNPSPQAAQPKQEEKKVATTVVPDSLKLALAKRKSDSLEAAKKLPVPASVFSYTPDKEHSVAVLLTKVDPVYVTETRNAFNRYNRENYYNQTFDITNVALDDTTKLVVISSFQDAATALDYMGKAQKLAPREIVPWFPAAKYSFIIITAQNLEVLKSNKDIINYKKFLGAYFPGKF